MIAPLEQKCRHIQKVLTTQIGFPAGGVGGVGGRGSVSHGRQDGHTSEIWGGGGGGGGGPLVTGARTATPPRSDPCAYVRVCIYVQEFACLSMRMLLIT